MLGQCGPVKYWYCELCSSLWLPFIHLLNKCLMLFCVFYICEWDVSERDKACYIKGVRADSSPNFIQTGRTN